MDLKDLFNVEFEAIPPYNFELTLRKPAGWYWSTPEEIFKKEPAGAQRDLRVIF